eukprot:7366474-Prymnesium_polylepis.1
MIRSCDSWCDTSRRGLQPGLATTSTLHIADRARRGTQGWNFTAPSARFTCADVPRVCVGSGAGAGCERGANQTRFGACGLVCRLRVSACGGCAPQREDEGTHGKRVPVDLDRFVDGVVVLATRKEATTVLCQRHIGHAGPDHVWIGQDLVCREWPILEVALPPQRCHEQRLEVGVIQPDHRRGLRRARRVGLRVRRPPRRVGYRRPEGKRVEGDQVARAGHLATEL